MLKEIPVICVTYQSECPVDKWLDSVQSLERDGVIPLPCIADNASDDRTASKIAVAINHGRIALENVFWLPQNLGFNAAQNHVLRSLRARNRFEFFATLNHDATADPDWLNSLYNVATNLDIDEKIGMFSGPILVPGSTQISSAGHAFRSTDGAFLDIDRGVGRIDDARCAKLDFEPFCPCFAAALWSFAMMDGIGLPNSQQFMYYDDVEWAYRARMHGWVARFEKQAVAHHPLPKSLKNAARTLIRWQHRGRRTIVASYFPESERERILGTASCCSRVPQSALAFSDAQKSCVYKQWANKHLS